MPDAGRWRGGTFCGLLLSFPEDAATGGYRTRWSQQGRGFFFILQDCLLIRETVQRGKARNGTDMWEGCLCSPLILTSPFFCRCKVLLSQSRQAKTSAYSSPLICHSRMPLWAISTTRNHRTIIFRASLVACKTCLKCKCLEAKGWKDSDGRCMLRWSRGCAEQRVKGQRASAKEQMPSLYTWRLKLTRRGWSPRMTDRLSGN